jgi:hypothetical protein
LFSGSSDGVGSTTVNPSTIIVAADKTEIRQVLAPIHIAIPFGAIVAAGMLGLGEEVRVAKHTRILSRDLRFPLCDALLFEWTSWLDSWFY